jgi:dTDP-glucose 4,6-dehydratase
MVPSLPLPAADLEQIQGRTADLWPDLQGGRILLTGGSGFFGSWLAEAFCAIPGRLRGTAQLWVLCRDVDRWNRLFPHLAGHPALRLVPGDLAGLRPLPGAWHGVIHAAAAPDAPYAQFRNTLDGLGRVLDFAQAGGARRILFTSSGAVYGHPSGFAAPIPESCGRGPRPEDPASAYGQAKRAAEGMLAAYAAEQQSTAVLARCFAFVGPRLKLDANYAIGNFIRDALWGDAIRIQGDGTPLRSYLYAADLAVWLWTLYFRGPSAQPIHVGSDQPVSITDLAQTVAAVLRPGLPILTAGHARPGQPAQCYVPAIDRARTQLGLAPWTGLEAAIRQTAAWYQQQERPHS